MGKDAKAAKIEVLPVCLTRTPRLSPKPHQKHSEAAHGSQDRLAGRGRLFSLAEDAHIVGYAASVRHSLVVLVIASSPLSEYTCVAANKRRP